MNLYKNGVLVSSNNAVASVTETQLYIGSFIGANYLKGTVDEVRIWSVALTSTQIRDWMCRKVTATHPQYANLIAYYKADEGTGTTLTDSKGANNGTLVGGPTWVTSGAALGDVSAYDYTNATKTATLTVSATGESFTATNTSGAADGIQIYQVNQAPTNSTGIQGIGGNNKYFGVFQIGGTNPTYTATYNYNTINSSDEASLRLYRRDNNSSPNWIDAGATQDQAANTLTVTLSGMASEFSLGSVNNPLPVSYLSVDVKKEAGGMRLLWSTSSEIDNSGFTVQRSTDGTTWKDLGFVEGNGTSSLVHVYGYLDGSPAKGLNIYRLKQVDRTGEFKYSKVVSIRNLTKNEVALYPVPAVDFITLQSGNDELLHTTAKIADANGRVVSQFIIQSVQERISLKNYIKGVYVIQLENGTVLKFVKQ
jgi:hypothetical protein